ncbi:hypothetical protein [Bacillus sp. SG-1]|uniref:hypothetical protein n=1 Tax=Bacillus sp. SG-1 TaxID=161544 RepID=UPI0002D91431|nr:hypothetical protein [Bacillus sp. SG-1]
MKKTWNQLFVRHGWLLAEKEENIFDCSNETEGNIEFLMKSLESLQVSFSIFNRELIINSNQITEREWIEAIDYEGRGRVEGLWFRPGADQPKIGELDTYISGIVRQLNRLGFHTMGSCDGHGEERHILWSRRKKILKSWPVYYWHLETKESIGENNGTATIYHFTWTVHNF